MTQRVSSFTEDNNFVRIHFTHTTQLIIYTQRGERRVALCSKLHDRMC